MCWDNSGSSVSASSGSYEPISILKEREFFGDMYKCHCLSCGRKMLKLAENCPSCNSIDIEYTDEYKNKISPPTLINYGQNYNPISGGVSPSRVEIVAETIPPSGNSSREELEQLLLEEFTLYSGGRTPHTKTNKSRINLISDVVRRSVGILEEEK